MRYLTMASAVVSRIVSMISPDAVPGGSGQSPAQPLDGFPLLGLPRAQHCVLHADIVDRLREAGRVLATVGDRRQIFELLDDLEVFVPDRVGVTRHKVAVIREAVAGVDGLVAEFGLGGAKQLQFVHRLEVPHQRPLRAVHLERALALRTHDRATRLEHATGTVLEHAHRAEVVLVLDCAGRVTGLADVVVGAARFGQWRSGIWMCPYRRPSRYRQSACGRGRPNG